jgi:hypothetical protein
MHYDTWVDVKADTESNMQEDKRRGGDKYLALGNE